MRRLNLDTPTMLVLVFALGMVAGFIACLFMGGLDQLIQAITDSLK